MNGCHDLTMVSINITDNTIITIKNVDYRCIIENMCKHAVKKLPFLIF